jgi:hypothetical protein
MAVAARPGPSDARVPCPLCGGLVHPVAGKCKHCKADLTAYRAARPAASAPLPPLQAHGANGHSNGAHAATHGPIAVAAPEVQPVLPPRPTARSRTAEPGGSTWRSWPVLVIVLAMGAIVVAVVLMVWPVGASEPGKRTLQPPPAPERMLTDPDVKPPPPPRAQPGGAPDPWSSQHAPAPAVPVPAPSAPDPDADDQDVDALQDPFAPADPSAARQRLRLNPRGALANLMLVRMCRKLIACRIDDPVAGDVCDQIVQPQPPPAPPTTCPAAQRCLQHIDDMACDNQSTSLSSIGKLLTQVEDCTEAASC